MIHLFTPALIKAKKLSFRNGILVGASTVIGVILISLMK